MGHAVCADPGGAPLSIRTTEYDIDRTGVLAGLSLQFGSNKLTFGGWIEDNDFTQARRFYPEPNIAAPTQVFHELPA